MISPVNTPAAVALQTELELVPDDTGWEVCLSAVITTSGRAGWKRLRESFKYVFVLFAVGRSAGSEREAAARWVINIVQDVFMLLFIYGGKMHRRSALVLDLCSIRSHEALLSADLLFILSLYWYFTLKELCDFFAWCQIIIIIIWIMQPVVIVDMKVKDTSGAVLYFLFLH